MGRTVAEFAPLQAVITRKNREGGFDAGHPWHHHLTVGVSAELLDVEYRGESELWLDDGTTVTILHDLLSLLASAEIAHRLRSFTYRTEAVHAANGTYSIVIDALVAREQTFPTLARFVLDQGEGEHGYKILASALGGGDGYYDEAGVLARLLRVGPELRELVTPSPPGGEFFSGDPHPLQSLDVDAAFGHADFIRHLAGCSRFPDLRRLVFTDFRQNYLADWQTKTTTFADYEAFFRSPVAARLDSVHLRDVNLSADEVRRLLASRSEGVVITRHE